MPKVPSVKNSSGDAAATEAQLQRVQAYLSALQYNHTGCQFFEVQKHLPLNRLLELGKRMAKLSLPIKCLEAVVLAAHLTTPLTDVSSATTRPADEAEH